MKLLFVDEFKGDKNKNIFGISLVCIDAIHYNCIRKSFRKSLKQNTWPMDIEFKGKYLFSRDPKGTGKAPEEMIELTKEIINHLSGENNSKCTAISVYNEQGYSFENYCKLVEIAILKLPKATTQKLGKNMTSLYFDEFNDGKNIDNQKKLSEFVGNALNDRNYSLTERAVTIVPSSNETPGICYADVLSYLSKWIIENPQDGNENINLFNLIEKQENIQKKKINTAYEIGDSIKKFNLFKME